jgi:hypothetical protein
MQGFLVGAYFSNLSRTAALAESICASKSPASTAVLTAASTVSSSAAVPTSMLFLCELAITCKVGFD